MTSPSKQAIILALCAGLTACAVSSPRGDLDKLLNEQIGKPVDDPSGFRVQQAKNRIATSRGPHGHVEEEYRVGLRQNCRVFLEIDNEARKVVTWRYGVPDDDCILTPATGR